MKPYAYQQADINALREGGWRGIVTAETGAGKTVIGAGAIIQSGAPVTLLIAPKGTHKKVWEKTLLAMKPGLNIRSVDGTPKGKLALDALEMKEPGVYLMSHNVFTRSDFGYKDSRRGTTIRPDMTIVDEVHLISNRDSKGGERLMRMGRYTQHPIVLSGTLYRNNFDNWWTINRFVYPDRDGARDISDIAPNRWITTYCETKEDRFAPNGYRVMGELVPGTMASLVPTYRQHFKREPCCEFHPHGFLADLPEPIVIQETVELTATQKKSIRQMNADMVAWLKDQAGQAHIFHTKLPITKELRLSQMTLGEVTIRDKFDALGEPVLDDDGMQKQELFFAEDCASPKYDRMMAIWDKNNHERMVVSTRSRLFAHEAVRRLQAGGVRAFEWSGAATQKRRDTALEEFERGELDIVVGVVEAISTGIDGLQSASGILVRLDRSRDGTSETQLVGRQDRRGQVRKEGMLIYDIVGDESDDEEIISKQVAAELRRIKSLKRQWKRSEGAKGNGGQGALSVPDIHEHDRTVRESESTGLLPVRRSRYRGQR